MTTTDGVIVFIGTYPDEESAQADYGVVRDLYRLGAAGTYDAAVVLKDPDGRVHVHKVETATQHGAWGGAAAGALVGILFPPAMIGTILVGAAVGGAAGHLWRGLSRSDVADLGQVIDDGQAALVIVGASTIGDAIAEAELTATKHVVKELDLSSEELDDAVRAAAGEFD